MCNQCNFKGKIENDCLEHMTSQHAEINSPDSKKSKIESEEEETLKKVNSLSVSESNHTDMKENVNEGNMEIDHERKRKRDEVAKEKPIEKTSNETTTTKRTLPVKINDPNTRSPPKQVQNVVSEGSKEAVVPGNGSCLIGTAVLHIEGDIENTPLLAKNLNTHMAMYREVYHWS